MSIRKNLIFLTTLLFCLRNSFVLSQPNETYVIEDGERWSVSSYYDEKPAVFQNTYDRSSQGDKSVYFKSGCEENANVYITKFQWPEPQDFSLIATIGTVSFDLWIEDPTKIKNKSVGSRFGFTLGSRSNEAFANWYIPSMMLKPREWNKVVLMLIKGRPVLEGSTVNGTPVQGSEAGVNTDNGVPDWSRIDYHKFLLPYSGFPIEGNIDNVAGKSMESSFPKKVVLLSDTDPKSHYVDAEKGDALRIYSDIEQGQDIIPPDVRRDAFFPDPSVDFSRIKDWKAELYNCEGVFCLSKDQAIRGVPNAKIEVTATGSPGRIVLLPPEPVKIPYEFDTLDCWLYGNRRGGGAITFNFKQKDGRVYSDEGGNGTWTPGGRIFNNWTLYHRKFPGMLPADTELVSIEIGPLEKDKKYVFHFDQLKFSSFKEFLEKPAPEFANRGEEVKIPVRESGSCPETEEKVETSLKEEDGKYIFQYRTGKGEPVRYIYKPESGTLSDLSVEIPGRGTFLPAEDSGPVFEFDGVSYSRINYSAEVTNKKAGKENLKITWKYLTPEGNEQSIDYSFALRGKTLVIKIDSRSCDFSFWTFGHAAMTEDAKVIEVPFMKYSPNILVTHGYFVSYLFDWYQSNVSYIPYVGINALDNDRVSYVFNESGNKYAYSRRTDGSKHPLREVFYITASSNFDEVLPTISNPPSPLKEVLKERLYKMVGYNPPNRMEKLKGEVDLYDRYGMNNMYIIYHASLWSYRGGEGPEPFTGRMRVSSTIPGGDPTVIGLFKHMVDKGFYPGYYEGYNFYQPHSDFWNYDWLALSPDGNWQATHLQAYHMKPWAFAELSATATKKRAEKFNAKVIYMDGWTSNAPFEQNDYDSRYSESGKMIDTLRAMATAYHNVRKSIGGPVFSEGCGRHFYTAGLNDGSYGQAQDPEYKKSTPFLVNFQLKKVHPLCSDMGMGCYVMFQGRGDDWVDIYRFICATIAFGNMGVVEPYWAVPDSPYGKFDVTLTTYFLMQQIQSLYTMEPVEKIEYFDGTKLISTSEAVLNGIYEENRVYLKYKNGLEIYANNNYRGKNWSVEDKGKTYLLPPGGWYARKGDEFLEFSSLIDGRRVDYVNSPVYTYLNGHGKKINIDGFETDRIKIKFKQGPKTGEVLSYPEEAK